MQCLFLTSACQPTMHSWHIYIWLFAVQEWVDYNLIALSEISINHIAANVVTKPLPWPTFSCHCDILLCNACPPFCDFSVTHCFSISVNDQASALDPSHNPLYLEHGEVPDIPITGYSTLDLVNRVIIFFSLVCNYSSMFLVTPSVP